MNKIINWEFLSDWSAEKAWWLGILYGDGNIFAKDGTYKVSACGTKTTMEKWGKLICEQVSPQQFKRSPSTYQVGIHSKELVQWFKDKYNMCGPKSATLEWPHDLPEKYEKDFVRGLIDSDGSLQLRDTRLIKGKNKFEYTVSYTSQSLKFIEKLRNWFENCLNIPKANICEYDKGKGREGRSTYSLKYRKISTVINICNFIYSDSSAHIRHDGKYEIYEWMKAIYAIYYSDKNVTVENL